MRTKTSPHSRIRQNTLRAETLEQRLVLTGNARLVADISTSPAGVFDGGNSLNDQDEAFRVGEYFVESNDLTFFAASGEDLGLEIWRTDGTAEGTVRVSDLARTDIARPKYPTEHDGELYFLSGVGDGHGGSLWKSDGTTKGTERLFEDLGVHDLKSTDDGLLFAHDRGGLSLWDGRDVVELATYGYATGNIAIVDDDIFFTRNNSELWVSDGTLNSGKRVAESVLNSTFFFSPSANQNGIARGDYAHFLAKIDGWTYYVIEDQNTFAVGRTDGTEDSGVAVTELTSISYDEPPRLSAYEGRLLITPAVTDLEGDAWVYDPDSGTLDLIDDETRQSVNRVDFPGQPELDLFVDKLGAPSTLWKSGAGEGEAVRLLDSAFAFKPVGDQLFFVRGEAERELWTTDGSVAGTVPVKDLTVGGDKYPRIEANSDNTVYFLGDDGESGTELWKSDGTIAGTVLVKEIKPGNTGSIRGPYNSNFARFTGLGDQVFIDTGSQGTWKHDQQSRETNQLHSEHMQRYLEFENDLILSSTHKVWRSDGTIEELVFESEDSIQTVFVHHGEIYVVTYNSAVVTLHAVESGSAVEIGSYAYGWYSTGSSIVYLTRNNVWQTNGSDKGSVLISDSRIDRVHRLGDDLIISVGGSDDPAEARQMWRTDGTYEGTRQIGQFNSSVSLYRAVKHRDHLYFFAFSKERIWQLWRTDGSREGTERVTNIESAIVGTITKSNNGLYVTVDSELGTKIVWRIESDLGDPKRIVEIPRDPDDYYVNAIFSTETIGGSSFFKVSAGNTTWREELWRTDGTAAGTEMLLDMNPVKNQRSERPSQIPIRVGDLMYFTADDGIHGMELWQTDGTVQGTQMVQDIRPGEVGSYPSFLTNIDGQLYFSANDGVHGTEPWVLNPVEPTIGDTNADGVVDSTDLNVVGLNWQQAAFGPENGDFNGDGFVDSADLNLLGMNWRRRAESSPVSRAALDAPSKGMDNASESENLGESIKRRSLRPRIGDRLRRTR